MNYYKNKCKSTFDNEYLEDIEYEKISNHLFHPSAYNIMPLLYKKLDTIFDLVFSKNNIILSTKDLYNEIRDINQRYNDYYNKFKKERYKSKIRK